MVGRVVLPGSTLTLQCIIDATRSMDYPNYGKLKRQVESIRNPIEQLFRLKALIDNPMLDISTRNAATLILKDLQNGQI